MTSTVEVFFRNVKTQRYGCWEWQGWLDKDGYGTFRSSVNKSRAHRWSYSNFVGPIGDLLVLHLCDNPKCVRPSHLFLGTQQDNMRDMYGKGRHHNATKTHCRKGHEFTPDNTRYKKRNGKRNGRECKICAYERNKKRQVK